MEITIKTIAYHRNGIFGAPFHVFLFTEENRDMVGILFQEPHHCAVLDASMTAAGNVIFGENSWRGDTYESTFRKALGMEDKEPGSGLGKFIINRR